MIMGKIQNEHQANVTKKRIKGFEETLKEYERRGPPGNLIQKAQRDGIKSFLEDLKTELAEWTSERSPHLNS